MKRRFIFLVILAGTFGLPEMAQSTGQPRLVVILTIDQLRGDMPWRFYDRFGPKGFRFFMDTGIVYRNANFRHATTATAVGHASLFTGGSSAEHGMVGNEWFDIRTGEKVYCVEDPTHALIGGDTITHAGTSPKNLTSTTIGDELILASNGKAKVFSLSIKDRGAIIPAGFLGKAFWYNSDQGNFVTSTYYYQKRPAWLKAWNDQNHASQYLGKSWKLLKNETEYFFDEVNIRGGKPPNKNWASVFPHRLSDKVSKSFYSSLKFTPFGDELTLRFAMELIDKERLGQDRVPDLLALSLSATDYIGHVFGPDSREAEDNLLRLDAALSLLIEFIGKKVGLAETLIVLSSDHGMDSSPEYKLKHGIPAGRKNPDEIIEILNERLNTRFRTEENLVGPYYSPNLYLNVKNIEKLGLTVSTVERAVVENLLEFPEIARAYARSDLLRGLVSDDRVSNRVKRAFHHSRSGHVVIVQKPSWFLHKAHSIYSATHGSPYTYDTHVPIMVWVQEPSFKRVNRLVSPEGIAPTIASYLGINAPSGSDGDILTEVLDRR